VHIYDDIDAYMYVQTLLEEVDSVQYPFPHTPLFH
jgi:hypothetical protein